jgi:hypothetical protein
MGNAYQLPPIVFVYTAGAQFFCIFSTCVDWGAKHRGMRAFSSTNGSTKREGHMIFSSLVFFSLSASPDDPLTAHWPLKRGVFSGGDFQVPYLPRIQLNFFWFLLFAFQSASQSKPLKDIIVPLFKLIDKSIRFHFVVRV